MLRNGGQRAGRDFISKHFDDIGVRSTVDLAAEAQSEWAVLVNQYERGRPSTCSAR